MWEQEAHKLAEDLGEANDQLEKVGQIAVLRADDLMVVKMEEDSHYAREYTKTVRNQIIANRPRKKRLK